MCTVPPPITDRFLASLRGHVSAVYQVRNPSGTVLEEVNSLSPLQIVWSSDSRLLCSGSSDSTLKASGRSLPDCMDMYEHAELDTCTCTQLSLLMALALKGR